MLYLSPEHPGLMIAPIYLAVGGIVLWRFWDKVPPIPSPQSGPFLIAFIITVVLLGLLIICRTPLTSRPNPAPMKDPFPLGLRKDGDDQYEYSTRDRTRFSADSPKVLGYPSTGGVLMLPFDIAVAEFLDLPRLQIAHCSRKQIDEDAFCGRMRLLGAKWWKSEETYMRKLIGFEAMTETEKKEGITVGWPATGGVWILQSRKGLQSASLRMCVNMEERCELLERWGATFYENPSEVEEFEEVFAERGVQQWSEKGSEEKLEDYCVVNKPLEWN